MESADIKWLITLEEENRQLKQLYADLSLGSWALKDIISNTLKPAGKRELVDFVR
jgi:putative transposase